jgi:hypothetical protein
MMEVEEIPDAEEQEIVDIMAPYGLDRETVQPIITKLRANPDKFVDFMMRFELNLEAPDPKRSMVRIMKCQRSRRWLRLEAKNPC